MAAGDSIIPLITNGRNVKQRVYIGNNGYYRDEWEINPYNIVLYGIKDELREHDHYTSMRMVKSILNNYGINSVELKLGEFSAVEYKQDLMQKRIVTNHGHGTTVFNNNVPVSSGVTLNDRIVFLNNYTDVNTFFSNNWSGITTSCEYIETNDDFSNIDLVLFLSCNTSYNDINDLPHKIVSHGAKTAIGFSDSIDCEQANYWLISFYSSMALGKTVSEAEALAFSSLNPMYAATSGLDSIVIVGDNQYKLP